MQFLTQSLVLQDDPVTEWGVINLYPTVKTADILGFGGAFTEASAYNYAALDAAQKQQMLRLLFDKKDGLGHYFCRLAIGSCDFALGEYSLAYKEDLSDFSIDQDRKYIIPFVKDALKYTNGKLFFFASPWSPPAFMKDSGKLVGGKLRKEYYATYAAYFVKFLQCYRAEGIEISAVSVQNEPKATQTWESCVFTAEEEGVFAADFLRPALDANGLDQVKIIVWDHNKERLYDRCAATLAQKGAADAVWGLGFHWYSGEHFDAIDVCRRAFPDKVVLETELCHGDSHDKSDEQRAMDYAVEYCENLHHGVNGICDWNMILDAKDGGPFHSRLTGGCYAALYVDLATGEIKKDAIYDAVALFSRHISAGDEVIATTGYRHDLHHVAVRSAEGKLMLFVINPTSDPISLWVRLYDKTAEVTVPATAGVCYEIENA